MIHTTEQALRAEIDRLQDAKRRALAIADERAKELAALRIENERLKAQLDSHIFDERKCNGGR
jgi:flagellin-like hook-associated protein FlgL